MAYPTMLLNPTKALLAAAGLVGASTAALPGVTGYGTNLFQLVALGAWGIGAAITSDIYSDAHHPVVWSVALCLNLVLFLMPSSGIGPTARILWPVVSSALISARGSFLVASRF